MERRVLKLGGRSYGDSMEGAVWKEWMEFRAKIQLFSDTAKFGGVIRKCLNYAFRLKVVKLPYSLYINFYYYLCIKLQHQGVE